MKLVADNTDADIARNRAEEQARWALVDLAANILRVVRGAGKPYDLPNQAAAFVKSYVDYREKAEGRVTMDLGMAISLPEVVGAYSKYGRDEGDKIYAERSIVRGALQIAASQLLEQRTQEASGEREMYQGINSVEDYRARQREMMGLRANKRGKPRPPSDWD